MAPLSSAPQPTPTSAPTPPLTPRKLDRTDVNGALTQAGKSSQKTSLSSAALQAALDRSGTSPKTGSRIFPWSCYKILSVG
jgi:hypothetical protein